MKTLALLAVLLLSATAVAAEPEAAPETTVNWQQANKRSAALLRGNGDRKQAADFARIAFDLYPGQVKTYNDAIHAQLLLNLVGARREAEGLEAALRELDRGAGAIEQRAGANAEVMLQVWQEGAALSRGRPDPGPYGERALGVAEVAYGRQDPRTVTLLLRLVQDLKRKRGYAWALGKYVEARTRAERSGNAALVDQISLFMAKLDLESGNTDRAVNGYRALIERLERRSEDDRDALLLVAYAQLEHLYEKRKDANAAGDVRRRRMERLPQQPATLVPLLRVQPEFPATLPDRGFVEMELLIGADGTVQDVIVIAAEPAGVFEGSAVDAIRKWKFKPKVVDGVPVVSAGRQRVEYAREPRRSR